MTTSQIDPALYQAAHQTAVYTDRSDLGMLKISGQSRLDLINRMSTQAVAQLPAGSGAATILTTDVGRIIDRLILYAGSEAVYALTGEQNADFIARYLLRFVFFNDDFHVGDVSADTAVFGIYGPQAAQKLAGAGFLFAPELFRHHWRAVELDGFTTYLHRTDPIAGHGYFLMADITHKEKLQQLLAAQEIPQADANAFDFLRIEAGQPRFGRELTQEYIPLEANLWDDVSFNKGCYIGQEIIARLESRGKLAKRLTPLRLTGPAEPNADLTSEGKKAGTLTSVGYGPEGLIVGLGYVKTAVLESDAPLLVGETAVFRHQPPPTT